MKWTVVYTAGVFRVRGDGKLTNEAGVFIDEDKAVERATLLNDGEGYQAMVEVAHAAVPAINTFNDQFYVPPNDPLYAAYEALILSGDAITKQRGYTP
jgi:hypothetical protein